MKAISAILAVLATLAVPSLAGAQNWGPPTCATGTCPNVARPTYAAPAYRTYAAPTYAAPTYRPYAAPFYSQTTRPAYRIYAAPTSCQANGTRSRTAAAYPVQPVGGDPYGFTGWLNATRARYGLALVSYDPGLAGWAAQNNAQQQARGMGHYVMGTARRQNSAVGSYASIGAMWMASPAHRAALLDPSIRRIGLAGLGAHYWTFDAS